MGRNITLEQVIFFLLETPMFEDLDATELSEIVHIMKVQHVEQGASVFDEGDRGDAWYVLFDGQAVVTKSTPFGPSQEVAILKPHACFGEMAILDGSSRSASVGARTDMTVFRFPRLLFLSLLDSNNLGAFKLVHGMAKVLCQRQRTLTQQFSDLLEEVSDADGGGSYGDLGALLDQVVISE